MFSKCGLRPRLLRCTVFEFVEMCVTMDSTAIVIMHATVQRICIGFGGGAFQILRGLSQCIQPQWEKAQLIARLRFVAKAKYL